MLLPFETSRLKIARARQHIFELETFISAFYEANPLRLMVEEGTDPSIQDQMCCWNVRGFTELPPQISIIIGDAVHNLRTSLDILAGDLVQLNSGNRKNVYFPFAGSANDLDAQINDKKMCRASIDVQKLLRSMKPYKGGNASLRVIHDLDARDKHSAIIASVGGVASPEFILHFKGQPNPIPEFASTLHVDGQTLLMLPKTANLPVGSVIPFTSGIVFEEIYPEGCPIKGREVVPTLKGFVDQIEGMVEAFAALFPVNTNYPNAVPPKRTMHRALITGLDAKGNFLGHQDLPLSKG
jgi:hypothetical protein